MEEWFPLLRSSVLCWFTQDDFRNDVVASSSCNAANGAGIFVVVLYHRGVLGQTGAGHFSPIGGYHNASDRVLIFDVARFKYPPHWVDLTTVWKAMQPKVQLPLVSPSQTERCCV